jgi:hypothetical protein
MKESFMDRVLTLLVCAMATAAAPVAPAPPPRPVLGPSLEDVFLHLTGRQLRD